MNKFSRFINSLDIDKELVTEFFIAFSRFEYALKIAGYINGSDQSNIDANWNGFLSQHKNNFYLDSQNQEVQEAAKYLIENPPKKQICIVVDKDKNIKGIGLKSITVNKKNQLYYLFSIIKVVRNNLFHGAKYPFYDVPEPARNRALLKNSLIILEALLEFDDDIKNIFYGRNSSKSILEMKKRFKKL